jgi:hypothetical protein
MVWRVGQKIVSIVNWEYGAGRDERTAVPEKDAVYTIRGIRAVETSARPAKPGEVGFLLVEILNPEVSTPAGIREQSFSSLGFRPVVEGKTDISVFQEILDRENQRARENA